ncbi:MerR family DNA-binding transcriptional regulator [Alicyclobacillus sp. SO9]|uniref:MerR family DNA-binding transcriptional regulator n=1 Tax=Alicyclobacillus sp. SO9 TaxID=2665646 RepID=UPI0018E88004|nr:MerR family DNA-binding transcriptional regulator [Alicyclobacillus sp. SO9]QQE79697.1 MerR family DNA-binding transcriptional regulator [Alicyclobacillus sp. SO9]
MQISELSRRTGVSVSSLRYYEQENLITPQRLENGYRMFDEIAVERVKAIRFRLNTTQIERVLDCDEKNTLPERNPVCEGM